MYWRVPRSRELFDKREAGSVKLLVDQVVEDLLVDDIVINMSKRLCRDLLKGLI